MRKVMVLITLLFILTGVNLNAASPTEIAALEAIYSSTDGDNWQDNSNWKADDPCTNSWYGIDCDISGNIINLLLNGNQLSGRIPAEIGNLSSLGWINLSNNQLTGTIPTQIGNLTNLAWLYLNMNQLFGVIPVEITDLSNLNTLSLSDNQLWGVIPAGITDLPLEYLYLYNNCNLYSNDPAVQTFINDVTGNADGYQNILDTNSHDCGGFLVPIITYLLF